MIKTERITELTSGEIKELKRIMLKKREINNKVK